MYVYDYAYTHDYVYVYNTNLCAKRQDLFIGPNILVSTTAPRGGECFYLTANRGALYPLTISRTHFVPPADRSGFQVIFSKI